MADVYSRVESSEVIFSHGLRKKQKSWIHFTAIIFPEGVMQLGWVLTLVLFLITNEMTRKFLPSIPWSV